VEVSLAESFVNVVESSDKGWLNDFAEQGGVEVIVEAMCKILSGELLPSLDTEQRAQFHSCLIRALRRIVTVSKVLW
jgi:hypothetical protein